MAKKRNSTDVQDKKRPDVVIFLDLGNALLKWCAINPETLGTVSVGAIPHGLAVLHEYQFDHALESYGGSDRGRDFFVFDDRYYVVGGSAEVYAQNKQVRIGAARFQRDYYVPLFLRVIAEIAKDIACDSLVASIRISYAAVDTDYRSTQIDLLKGEFAFRVAQASGVLGERRVEVVEAKHYNETHGGYLSAALDIDLQQRTFSHRLIGQPQIVIDVGGSTVTAIRVGGDGVPDLNPASTYSVAGVGILTSVTQLVHLLRNDEQLHEVMRTTSVPQSVMLDTLRTGHLKRLGVDYDVRAHVASALAPVLLQVHAAVATLGSGLGVDGCVVTGGGGALITKYLYERYPSLRPHIAYPAEPHMGNVYGAYKAHCALQFSKETI